MTMSARFPFIVFVLFLLATSYAQSAHAQFVATIQGEASILSRDVDVDDDGYSYVTGGFAGVADFDPGDGEREITSVGLKDIFVAKYDPAGAVVWSFGIGGVGGGPGLDDEGLSVQWAPAGDIYVTGYFQGTADFDPGAGTAELTSQGIRDVFVASYTADGVFRWARGFGGIADDVGNRLAVSSDGAVYVTGRYQEMAALAPESGTPAELTSLGQEDGFVLSLDTSGEANWAISYGGASVDEGRDIATDDAGHLYLLGTFSQNVDFDPSAGEQMLSSVNGSLDVVLASYTKEGALRWAISTGSGQGDGASGLAVDGAGNAYITGHFVGTSDFDPGPDTFELVSFGVRDVFLAKYKADSALEWAFPLGSGFAEGSDVALDAAGHLAFLGAFSGGIFPDPASTVQLTSLGEQDVLVASYRSDGSFLWAGNVGGALTEFGSGLAIGPADAVVLTGYFEDTVDFDAGQGVFELDSQGEFDAFLVEYNADGTLAVGIEEHPELPSDEAVLDVYPNPAVQEDLTVFIAEAAGQAWTIDVIDALGRDVYRFEEVPRSGIRMRINTRRLAAGTYYVRASGDRQVLLQPFVVAR